MSQQTLNSARATAAYVADRTEGEANRKVRATLREAERRIQAFDRATNARGAHQAFQASLRVLQEMRDAVGGSDVP